MRVNPASVPTSTATTNTRPRVVLSPRARSCHVAQGPHRPSRPARRWVDISGLVDARQVADGDIDGEQIEDLEVGVTDYRCG
jgi:hypothetical protein